MAAVLIREACSAAFYCQRCGKVHVHDIPYFMANRTVLRCDRCGQTQVVCERNAGGRQIVFTVGCVLCGNESRAVYSLKSLPQIRLEKIFCQYDHFELGYIGRRRNPARRHGTFNPPDPLEGYDSRVLHGAEREKCGGAHPAQNQDARHRFYRP